MNIREAILKAADHIERNPDAFRFIATNVPDGPGCGTPGCALGWIGAFSGKWFKSYSDVSERLLGLREEVGNHEFYRRMDEAAGIKCWEKGYWKDDAAGCARALRLYADKFHPAKPVVTPNWSCIASAHPIPDDVRSQELSRV